jgi:hypothetical protein
MQCPLLAVKPTWRIYEYKKNEEVHQPLMSPSGVQRVPRGGGQGQALGYPSGGSFCGLAGNLITGPGNASGTGSAIGVDEGS